MIQIAIITYIFCYEANKYLSSTMNQDGFRNLLILCIEKYIKINSERILQKIITVNKRKMLLPPPRFSANYAKKKFSQYEKKNLAHKFTNFHFINVT